MKNIGRTLFALSLAGISLCATSAQEKMSIPKVLQIQREFLKPGKGGNIHEVKESAFIDAMSRAKWPTHYIGMTSLSGKSRALFFTSYASLEAWEKDYAAVGKNAALSSALDRAYAADGELLDSTDTGVFLFQEEMSLRPKPDLGAARFMEISAYHVRPGHNKEWTEAVKLVKAAYEKGVPESHWGVFEQAYGGDGGTYLVLTSHKSLSEVDQGFADDKKFVATMGEDGMKKLSELIAACVESSQHQLFAINPHMSYVSDEWIKASPDFWGVKHAAAKAPASTKKDKP
ncbi:MAG TPA: hypothetical protein VFI38_18335 [Candidatus Acidoferrum sp.]|nr:hypothetical protein [Candidatus Acidoferrum sp.]